VKVTGLKTTAFICRPGRGMDAAYSPAQSPRKVRSVVELDTDEGLVGIAIATAELSSLLRQLVDEVLLGEDPRAVTGLWERMRNARSKGGDRGLVGAAIAILDVALWDLKAKANSEPLWKALGGSRPRINAHASACELASERQREDHWLPPRAVPHEDGPRGG
jgi:L-alanine-DL-glutamate epimerase-like enolase superfamily enzyme